MKLQTWGNYTGYMHICKDVEKAQLDIMHFPTVKFIINAKRFKTRTSFDGTGTVTEMGSMFPALTWIKAGSVGLMAFASIAQSGYDYRNLRFGACLISVK